MSSEVEPTATTVATSSVTSPGATAPADRPWVAYQRWGPGNATHVGLVRGDGTEDHVLEVTGVPVDDQSHPAWTPDGSRIGFDVFFDDPIVRIGQRVEPWWVGVDGGPAERLADCALPCLQLSYPAFAPDGRSVALIRYDVDGEAWGPSALEIVDLTNRDRRTIAETEDGRSAWYHPRWSTDGTAIVVAVETYTDAEQGTITGLALGVIDIDQPLPATLTFITPPDVVARDPDWGGASGRISFSRLSAVASDMASAELTTIRADGTDIRPVTEAQIGAGAPSQAAWDPNGPRLAFTFDDHSSIPPTIGFIGVDGTGVSIMPIGIAPRTHPRIQPMAPATGG